MTQQPPSPLDDERILAFVFHPRKDWGPPVDTRGVKDVLLGLPSGVNLGARFYAASPCSPVILYFHGNGEVARDYDDIAPFYIRTGLNLLVVDYRGYGRSSGKPTLSSLIQDASEVLDPVMAWLRGSGISGALWVMGRSLGSLPAIHLARFKGELLNGLIVESGFADTLGLLRRIGVSLQGLAIPREWERVNLENISEVSLPTLIIHGEFDEIIPLADGQALYERCPSSRKRLLVVQGAGHNDIFWVGRDRYIAAIEAMIFGGS